MVANDLNSLMNQVDADRLGEILQAEISGRLIVVPRSEAISSSEDAETYIFLEEIQETLNSNRKLRWNISRPADILYRGNPISGTCSRCHESVNLRWRYCPCCGSYFHKDDDEIPEVDEDLDDE